MWSDLFPFLRPVPVVVPDEATVAPNLVTRLITICRRELSLIKSLNPFVGEALNPLLSISYPSEGGRYASPRSLALVRATPYALDPAS